MNIHFQPNIVTTSNNYKKNNNQHKFANSYKNDISFGAASVPTSSKYLAPFYKFRDFLIENLAKNYYAKFLESGIAKFLAEKAEKLNGVVDHMQFIGSLLISSMYMIQTLRNEKLDDEKKKTLAINQGLTFVISTLGAYIVDSKISNWWEGLALKYADNQITPEDVRRKLKANGQDSEFVKAYKVENAAKKAQFLEDQAKGLIKKSKKYVNASVKDFVHNTCPDKILENRLYGMNIFRKLLVFGMIYRFITPVAVTPAANWFGNKFIYKNKKEDVKPNAQAEVSNDKSKSPAKAA